MFKNLSYWDLWLIAQRWKFSVENATGTVIDLRLCYTNTIAKIHVVGCHNYCQLDIKR